MLKIITSLLDLLFPPRPEAVEVAAVQSSELSDLYTVHIYEEVHTISRYDHPTIRALIKENKFHTNTQSARLLATLLQRWLKDTFPAQSLVLVPVPLHASRERERGYNQVSIILSNLTLEANWTITPLLQRTTNTRPQTSLHRKDRGQNVFGAFEMRSGNGLVPNTYVLIDDVVTTGATMKAARAALAPHLPPGSTLHCVALAH
ncbi:MAG TPA: hypothetical protein VGE31_03320 [Candidatus Paceibacterota bacterium]